MSQLDQEFYNGLAGLMGLFLENQEDTGALYDAKEDFHKVFFLYHALHGNAAEYAERCIDQIRTKWKQDGNVMAIHLRPGVNIPDALVRTYIENAAISCRKYMEGLFPKTQEGKSTKYTSPRPFGDTIDVVV